MAKAKNKPGKNDKRDELETLRTEYRTLIGRAIIAGLITPSSGAIGRDLFLAAPDYNQDTGDYVQSGGGDHEQNAGDYTQSP